jgi:DNA-binding IclR family transcriptional regulator
MQEWIDEAAEQGYAVSHGERDAGLSAVAVPILGRSASVVAALTLSGPTVRFTDDRVATFTEALLAAAARMNERGFDHPLSSSH